MGAVLSSNKSTKASLVFTNNSYYNVHVFCYLVEFTL